MAPHPPAKLGDAGHNTVPAASFVSLVPMAHLEVDDSMLRLSLSRLERLAGLHRDVEVRLGEVVEVHAVDDAWTALRGIRAPGTGIPRVLMIGTTRSKGRKDFCVVRGRGPAVVITLSGGEFSRLVVSDPEADRTATRLTSAIGS